MKDTKAPQGSALSLTERPCDLTATLRKGIHDMPVLLTDVLSQSR